MSFNGLNLSDYRAIYENSLEGILYTSPDGQTIAANPAACRILRMTDEQICRAGRRGVIDLDDKRWTWWLAERESFGNIRGHVRMKRGDGSRFTADVSSAIFVSEGGERRAYVSFREVGEMGDAIDRQVAVVEDVYFEMAVERPVDEATVAP